MQPDYFLIASRDPYTHGSARRCYELAARLADEGCRVTLFLVQNGVLPARPGAARRELARPRAARRAACWRTPSRCASAASPPTRSRRGWSPRPLEVVIEALEHGAQALWH